MAAKLLTKAISTKVPPPVRTGRQRHGGHRLRQILYALVQLDMVSDRNGSGDGSMFRSGYRPCAGIRVFQYGRLGGH
jgi:hypothetical protein